MDSTIDPPTVDPRFVAADDPPTHRSRDQLVAGLMEARSLSKPDAEDWLDEHGATAGHALLHERWSEPYETRERHNSGDRQ